MDKDHYCEECIAEFCDAGEIVSTEKCLTRLYGKDWAYRPELILPGMPCDRCEKHSDVVYHHPELQELLSGR